MISVPIAVYNNSFKFQLDLFWFAHKRLYSNPYERARAIIIERNYLSEQIPNEYQWSNIDVPYKFVKGICDSYPEHLNLLPLNIQLGIESILNDYSDDEVIELLDCDMFHLEHRDYSGLQHDIILCDNIYEDWHLKSLTDYKYIINPYFENNGNYYNGGFVPLIATVKTFKKLIYEWKAVHYDICKRDYSDNLKWWAGMYALQASCEKNKVQMVALNNCYIPPVNNIKGKTIAHYSVDDDLINKRTFKFTDKIIDKYTQTIVEYVKFRNNPTQ